MGETDGLFGRIPKTIPALLQQPELDTDPIMTGENNPTQEQKDRGRQVHPPINFSDSTQEMKTEKIHSQRLPMGPETIPLLNNATPLVDYDWAQNDWGANYYSWGMPMTMPMYWEIHQRRKTRAIKRGGTFP